MNRKSLTTPAEVNTVYDIDAFIFFTAREEAPALDFSSIAFTRPV